MANNLASSSTLSSSTTLKASAMEAGVTLTVDLSEIVHVTHTISSDGQATLLGVLQCQDVISATVIDPDTLEAGPQEAILVSDAAPLPRLNPQPLLLPPASVTLVDELHATIPDATWFVEAAPDQASVQDAGIITFYGAVRIADDLTVTREPALAGYEVFAADAVHIGDAYAESGSQVALGDDDGVRVSDAITAFMGLRVSLRDAVTVHDAVTANQTPLFAPVALEAIGLGESVVQPVLVPPMPLAATLTDAILVRETATPTLRPLFVAVAPDHLRISDHLTAVMPSSDAELQALFVEFELAGVGNGWTDVTADVARDRGITMAHGMSGTTPADRVGRTPTATFELVNASGTRADGTTRPEGLYSLHHAATRAGWALNVGCRIRILDPATSLYHTQFLGRVDTVDPSGWPKGIRRVAVSAVGWTDEAQRARIVPDVGEQIGKRGDEVLTALIAEMAVAPYAVDFDEGREAYPFALDQSAVQQPVYTEFAKLAASEFGFIYERPDGTLRYESRHARLNAVSQWTITDAIILTPETGLAAGSARDRIANTIRVTVHPKVLDSDASTIVYNQTNAILIPSGTTKLLMGDFKDPLTGDTIGATDVQPLVAGVDYVGNDSESGAGADRTADLTLVANIGQAGARFSVTNLGNFDLWLTTLQLRGRGIYDREALILEQTDPASIQRYGERVSTLDMPYQTDPAIGDGAASYLLITEGADVARAHEVTVFGRDADTMTQILTRTISDAVTVVNALTGVNDLFVINARELTMTPTGHLRARYTFVRVVVADYWVLDESVLGVDTVLAPF